MKIYGNIDTATASAIPTKPKPRKPLQSSGPLPDTTLPIDKIKTK